MLTGHAIVDGRIRVSLMEFEDPADPDLGLIAGSLVSYEVSTVGNHDDIWLALTDMYGQACFLSPEFATLAIYPDDDLRQQPLMLNINGDFVEYNTSDDPFV